MAMDRESYLRELAAAYQGELRGETGFRLVAELLPAEAETWLTLARLEAATRERLLPLMQRHGLDTAPDPAEQDFARKRALDRASRGHEGAIARMAETLPHYVDLYGRLEAEGPAEDRDGLAFLNAHEVALQEFCRRVAAGEADPLAPVHALLDE